MLATLLTFNRILTMGSVIPCHTPLKAMAMLATLLTFNQMRRSERTVLFSGTNDVLHHWRIASLTYCITDVLHHWRIASLTYSVAPLTYCITDVLHHWRIASLAYCITGVLHH
jgi:hypothetical protein